ncbi:MAG: DUF4012 domain-containing protein [Actinomycetes bacterium]
MRVLRPALLLVGALVLLWVAAVAVTGFQASRALQTVASSSKALTRAVGSGDWTRAKDDATRLRDAAADADAATSRWFWRAASSVPLLGDQLDPLTAAGAASNRIAPAVPGAVQQLQSLEDGGLVTDQGQVDLAKVEALVPTVEDLASRTGQARSLLADAQKGRLLPPLRPRLDSATQQVVRVDDAARYAATLLPVVPDMLGAQGPRQYLIGFTNPAEVRPVQGIVGAYGLLSAEDGRLELEDAGPNSELSRFRADPAVLGKDFLARYGTDPALIQNVTMSVDASDAAQLLSGIWVGSGHTRPDGVLFLDPIGVQQLLAGQRSLQVPGNGKIAVSELTRVLLYDAYVRFGDNQGARERFLTEVTAAAFSTALENGVDRNVVQGAARAVQDGHLIVYSANQDEQRALQAVGATGTLPAPATQARIYLTNADPSKLDNWLTGGATFQPPCLPGKPARISLTLHSDVPQDVPAYMQRQDATDDAMARTAQRIVALYLPPGAEVVGANLDGKPVGLASRTDKGWRVELSTVEVPAGKDSTLTWYVNGPDGSLPTSLELQPLLRSDGVRAVGACS